VTALLNNPSGPPTIALSAFAITGGLLVLPKIDLLFRDAKKLLDDAQKTAEVIEQPVKSTIDFGRDIKACVSSAVVTTPLGTFWLPGLSEPRFISCMLAKGYAGATIAEVVRKL